MRHPNWAAIAILVVIAVAAALWPISVGADAPVIPCLQESCIFSTNVPYDAQGTPDTRPGTWGDAGYDDVAIPFVNVPAGYRVRVLRVYGDFVAWPHGRIRLGTDAGALFGILTPSAAQSPFVGAGLGSSGCFIYLQQGVGAEPVRAAFDFDVAAGGLLDADNTMLVRRAVFLNETGVSIHMEPTFVVEFRYEREK